jgi:hypothetical protein
VNTDPKWTYTHVDKTDTVDPRCVIYTPEGHSLLTIHGTRRDIEREARDLVSLLNITKAHLIGETEVVS